MKISSQKGFTLVELSIVLVIIGLIVSSVLVGQDLIRQGELRATVTQYEQFQAAVATFKTKYNGFPGDMDATGFFSGTVAPGTTTASNVTGDGVLAVVAAAADTGHGATSPNLLFWEHLGSNGAALISGSFDGTAYVAASDNASAVAPEAKSGNHWAVYAENGVNYYIIGFTGGVSGDADNGMPTADSLTPLDASSIDSKIDDGKPSIGTIVARDGNATDPDTVADEAASGCVSENTVPTASATYRVDNSSDLCTLRIRMSL